MTPRVLYCCPCTLAVGPKSDQAVSSSSSNKLDHRSDPQAPSITPRNKTNNSRNILDTIPPLPCYDAPSQYSYFSLDELYFCEECDQIKCKRCTTAEVSAYYCPACLYDVQAANVKADRMRCMRSCYVCPICETTMQVVASDPKQSVNLLSAAANQGEAPFFLLCSCCKWDSKEIGWTFDKQTGISMQRQRAEEQAIDLLEFEHLLEHFDAYYKSLELINSTNSATPSSGLSLRHQAALSAAAKSSKLLRDVPILSSSTHSRYILGTSRYKQAEHPLTPRDEISDYRTVQSYLSGKEDDGNPDNLGPVAKAENFKRRWLSQNTKFEDTTTTAQKNGNVWEQQVRAKSLVPLRKELKTKLTKRCRDCSHILIRPDVKSGPTSQNDKTTLRFKIKLVAMHFLPHLKVSLAEFQHAEWLHPSQQSGSSFEASRLSKRTSMMNLYNTRRNQSVLGSSNITTGGAVDTEKLLPGRSYNFECTFTNPLEDAMIVRVSVVKPLFSGALRKNNSGGSSGTNKGSRVEDPASWSVTPSVSSFSLAASSMLTIDDEDLLLGDGKKEDSEVIKQDESDVEDEEEEEEEAEGEEDENPFVRRNSARNKRGGRNKSHAEHDGVVRQKGNTATIGLDLNLGKETHGEIEVAMRVTFRYQDAAVESSPERRRKGETNDEDDESLRNFTFWTAIRLGYCEAAPMPSGGATASRQSLSPGTAAHSSAATSGAVTPLAEMDDEVSRAPEGLPASTARSTLNVLQ